MRSYIRSLWVSVVCAVVLSGAPGVAVAHEANPSSGSSGTTLSLMAMSTPTSMTSKMSSYGNGQLGAAPTIRAAACNSADLYAACISLAPSREPAGAQVTVNGTGWIDHANRGLDVPINIGMAEVARAHPNADGTFRVGLTIPTSTPEGEVELDAIIGNGGSASAQYTVTSGGASSGQARPSVTLSPSNGSPGTVTTADGHGFIPNQSVTVTQSGGPGITGGGGTVQADQSGSIKMSFRISDQTPQGIITVTFTQGANIIIAHFDVKRSPSGGGGALTDPAKDTGGQFLDWLNACVNGDLNEIDPECKQAARDLAGLGHSTTEVAACLEDLWKHPKTLGAWCSLEKMGGLLRDWLGHKAHK